MPALVIMGVSGCGKTSIARALAAVLECTFVEGDALHPAANIAKMAAGEPLDDSDRLPFLRNVGEALALHAAAGVVVSCSALKRSYRDLLRSYCSDLCFVLPTADRVVLQQRLLARRNHFMPVSLLDSQLAALETPQPDECAMLVAGDAPLDETIAAILAWLQSPQAGACSGKARIAAD